MPALPVETKVAVIFHRLGPYHWARLNAAGQSMRVLALEAFAEEEIYPWDRVAGDAAFTRVTVCPRSSAETAAADLQQGVDSHLDAFQPAAVAIPGWINREALAGLSWCVRRRVPAILMSESTAWDERRVWWKEAAKRRIVRLCSAALAGGRPHGDYLRQLGFPADRIFCGYDAVDNAYFETEARRIRQGTGADGAGHSLPPVYFLASARFVEKKNLPRLLQAYARYRALSPAAAWPLVLLGDGPLRAVIEAEIRRLRIAPHVMLPGFRQYPDLPAYFARAGVFIHASTSEQWGLVVNEAMASGLPVLVSDRCGCAQDLVRPGENGFTFDPLDVEALAHRMAVLAEMDSTARLALGERSREVIAAWGPARFADGLGQAIQSALEHPRPKTSLPDRWLVHFLLHR